MLINEVSESLDITADKQMLHSILHNLISNAIKFTNLDGTVKIKAREENNLLEISVQDNGVGISNEKLNNMFHVDKNISTKGTNQEKGTGLGLHLCKEFVEKHDGRIWVKSELGKGSEFCFTIPCKKDTNLVLN
ncbi:MAG: sensor histidine kinase [Methanococcaceae archaeon]